MAGDRASRVAELTPEQRARLQARLAGREEGAPAIARRTASGPAPLSFAQQRLWFLDRLTPGVPTYNMPAALRLRGPLDEAALRRALDSIVARHEALRTTIRIVDDQPMQLVGAPAPLPLACATVGEAELNARLQREAQQPFDLERGPLLRASLFRLGAEEHVLAVTVHHIVFDGWSFDLLRRELCLAYEAFAGGRAPELPPLAVQYADWAAWQRDTLGGTRIEEQLGYWKKQLAGAPTFLPLPTDRPRPAVQRQRGAVRTRVLSAALLDGARALAREVGGTTFMTLLAAWQAVLARVSGEREVLVGTPIANRAQLELEPLIGFFVNTVVVRAAVDGEAGFRALVERVRDAVLGADAHQDLPFERVVEALNPPRTTSHSPLFQVLFQADERPPSPRRAGALVVEDEWVPSQTAKFDLSLALAAVEGGLRASLEYDAELFDESTIDALLGAFAALLGAALARPAAPLSSLPLVSDAERAKVLALAGTSRVYDARPAHALVAAQVARTPDAPAVEHGGSRLSFAELHARSNQLAHRLIHLGAGGQPIALAIDRSLELAVAVLAVWKAGGACVPLEASHPRERLRWMLEETSAPVVLAHARRLEGLPLVDGTQVLCVDRDAEAIACEPSGPPSQQAAVDDLAYIVYTSGSTGRPKGVEVPHRTLANLIAWHVAELPSKLTTLQLAPLAFDVSFYELLIAWCSGGLAVIADDELRHDPRLLAERIAAAGVQKVVLPVVLLQGLAAQLADDPAPLAGLREVISTGAELRVTDEVRRLFTRLPGCRLHNHYGPSEAHVVTAQTLDGAPASWPASPSIGRAIPNVRAYVLDARLQPVPVGVPGELYLGGDALARGYRAQPERTAERFVGSPFGDGRLYRTGDRARWSPDGTLQFLGRVDEQIKLRGMRIEPGEIEATLLQHPHVQAAAVALRDERLIAWVQPRRSAAPTEAELRAHLERTLPAAWVPSRLVTLPSLPLGATGKIDKQALPSPESSPPVSERGVAPRTATEARIAEIWQEVLKLPQVSVDDDFFEVGGHSLLATQVVARVARSFGVQLMVRRIFEQPTVAGLAHEVEQLAAGRATAVRLGPRAELSSWPLSHNQERMLAALKGAPDAPEVMSLAFAVEGPLELDAFAEAAREVLRRHEVLRARFALDREPPEQTIDGSPRAFEEPYAFVDLSDGGDGEARALALALTIAREPVDAARGPLFRMRLVRVEAARHLLLVFVHHAIWDGISAEVLITDLATLHDALVRRTPLPEAPKLQYADFADWQRRFYTGSDGAAQIAWWQRALEGARGPELPTDHPRAAVEAARQRAVNTPFQRGGEYLPARPGLLSAIHERARRQKASPYEVLVAGFFAWLARRAEQDDLTLCSQHQNRHLDGTQRLIGPFAQALVLRVDTGGDPPFVELLERVRRTLQAARQRADVCGPFLGLHRFRVNFNYFPTLPRVDGERDALIVKPWRPIDLGRTIWYDLTLHATSTDGELQALLWFNRALWEASTARRWIAEYGAILDAVCVQPELRLSGLP